MPQAGEKEIVSGYHVGLTDHEQAPIQLGVPGFTYQDLYDISRLEELAARFDQFLAERDSERFERFRGYRDAISAGIEHGGLSTPEESALLIEASRDLARFLITLFRVESEAERIRSRARKDAEIARFKKEFVAKRVAKVPPAAIDGAAMDDSLAEALIRAVTGAPPDRDREFALATTVNRLTEIERGYPRPNPSAPPVPPSAESRAALLQILDSLRTVASHVPVLQSLHTVKDQGPARSASPESFERERRDLESLMETLVAWSAKRRVLPSPDWDFRNWTSFRLPRPLQFDRLVDTEIHRQRQIDVHMGAEHHLRRRDGFELTDPRFTPREITDEAHYCIFCHERKKDSCSHGLREKDDSFKLNPLRVPLEGCPLDEKIGESNQLRAEGDSIAALAVVMIDNPMCPGTGHRICNDCMRSCIFQKQEPVNIPQIETGILTDVLSLPWGFEIYSLLTRWNPLHVRRPVMRPYNGKNVMVVGLGPAGYTLAHYLANEGFGIVAIDALKLEPLPAEWIGEGDHPPLAIRDIKDLWDRLDERVLAGFGGVSEYGITVRWDKNFLKCIRLALERRRTIRFYGGTRFGGTLTLSDAFDLLGFHHVAIAAGAGTPTIVRMKSNLVRGIRKASDFLMALQLTGAFKRDSLANLQARLPAIVIGGGLTAIDTATELFAYYPVQVEKMLERYTSLVESFGAETVRAGYDAEEIQILDEFLDHGHQVRQERQRSAAAGEPPDLVSLVRGWGGVTIAYRKSLIDSPAYRLNYEEVAKAMEEGIGYAENLSPIEALTDSYGHLRALLFEKQKIEDGRWLDSGEIVELPARSVMVAAGTSPNVIYEREHTGTFKLDPYGQFFQMFRARRTNGSIELEEVSDPNEDPGFFTSYVHPSAPGSDPKVVSFYGDNHPRYAGNVVKAMASARDGYRHVLDLFKTDPGVSTADQRDLDSKWEALVSKLDDGLTARVVAVNRLTPTIVEVILRAPFAAERFKPGQFYRLQNYESLARKVGGTTLVMEGIALTGAWTRPQEGLLSLIILEMGVSSRLSGMLRPGEPVVVMGPTGTPTEIPRNETVLLAGGGLGNAVLFSIARALRDNGCRVIYFAGYKKHEDVFKRDEIEAGTDQVIWAVDRGTAIPARRPNDLSFVGNIVQAMLAYATGDILSRDENSSSSAQLLFRLSDVTRLIAIGSDGMMRAVKDARRGVLGPHLSPQHVGVASINSPMQCMMKQVCAQCLQRQVDPVTGKERFVFSCFNQDQYLDEVDFDNLRARLRQNTVSEKLANLWLTRILASETVEPAMSNEQ